LWNESYLHTHFVGLEIPSNKSTQKINLKLKLDP